jgi:putative serine protease PepD
MTADDYAFRPTADELRETEERRRLHSPRLAPRPADPPGPAAAFGRPAGVSGPFARPPGEPAPGGPGRAPRPAPPPVLAMAFSRPGAEPFAPPAGARLDSAPVPEPPWWKPDAPRDPWRDPSSPAYLAGPPDLNGPPAPAPVEGEAEEPAAARRFGFGPRLSLTTSLVLLLVGLLVGTAGGVTGYLVAKGFGVDDLFSPDAVLTKVSPNVQRPPGSVADIAGRVLPAVVSIEAHSGERGNTGSGVVVDGKGYILTNNHVVAVAAGTRGGVRVVFADQSSVPAKIVGRDPETDLAVLKVDRPGLAVATLGDSDALAVGDSVIAIGSPLGLAGTVTRGIVSSLHRPLSLQEEGINVVIDAIQTDAAINPGNSGGALVDGAGAVVGINTTIFTTSSGGGPGGSIGLGFAIPINEARNIAEQIIRTGSVKHATLAVNARSVTQLNGNQDGALVEAVQPGGAGYDAGLRENDVITKVDGTLITGADKLTVTIRAHRVGDTVKITFVRGSQTRTTEAKLQAD